ncbi:MAG: helix-hairpin-helix domain-containing protein [Clostridia bacterium]|nr:helix-hairpin-helix domain-containing protein [Clostridia bacterium]
MQIFEEANKNDVKLININKASEEELQKLTGIGESTAKKIINYREEYGKFKTIEDIKNVSGIGDAKFEAIKKDITV